ncbi:MAG: hypothetical protein KC457_33110, partial [Myxococcales bacterium]|nr:hypothetical protein [Myxococcales bacterium]
PTIDEVLTHPFISLATGPRKPVTRKQRFLDAVASLGEVVQIRDGQYFLAAGVRFESFKVIETFALLTASFGSDLEIGLTGVSKLRLPLVKPKPKRPVKPIVLIEMPFVARWKGELLEARGRLSDASYVLSPKARLGGDFALSTWLGGEHEGDFVATVGGYHPDFAVPAHYPSAERLTLTWRLNKQVTIKGSAYAALMPSRFMAGGNLELAYEWKSLKLWFGVGADFQMGWAPLSYSGRAQVSGGASYRLKVGPLHKTIRAEIGAQMRLWGPPFGGEVGFSIGPLRPKISFGEATPSLTPIDVDDFRQRHVPETLGSVELVAGRLSPAAVAGDGDAALPEIDPDDLIIETRASVPCTAVRLHQVLDQSFEALVLGPANVSTGVETVHTVHIERDGRAV